MKLNMQLDPATLMALRKREHDEGMTDAAFIRMRDFIVQSSDCSYLSAGEQIVVARALGDAFLRIEELAKRLGADSDVVVPPVDVTEPAPEAPVEVETEQPKPKRKRGRPKGSRNKKKTE
ncbi:MAG TPA: hypothetical protein VNA25_26745 [Phycisphaerae bacterium]|nr:hypothetical protein [Phycisphaerae bacterium]